MKQLFIGIAVAIVVVLGAYILVKPTNAPMTTPAEESGGAMGETSTAEPVVMEATPTATPVVGAVEEKEATKGSQPIAETLKVSLSNLKFSPSTLTIKVGKAYRLELSSKGPHTYTIDDLSVNFAVASGETKTFDLSVSKKGTYNVYCATPGHSDAGMVGKLIVN